MFLLSAAELRHSAESLFLSQAYYQLTMAFLSFSWFLRFAGVLGFWGLSHSAVAVSEVSHLLLLFFHALRTLRSLPLLQTRERVFCFVSVWSGQFQPATYRLLHQREIVNSQV